MSRWCDRSIHDAGHSVKPNGPLRGRGFVWNPCRGNHLGQRSCASAPTGRTYGRKRSDQNTAKTPCEEGAVHIWDAVKKLATVSELLRSLEKEDDRLQSQILELGRTVFELSKEVRELSRQMKGIEKRLDDKDKLVDATVKLRIMEETERLRAEFTSSGN